MATEGSKRPLIFRGPDYVVSTQTFVVYTDIGSIDLAEFDRRVQLSGPVIGVKYETSSRGVVRPPTENARNFLKCVTMTVALDGAGKRASVKLFRNGSMQLTGCKSDEQAVYCLDVVFDRYSEIFEKTTRIVYRMVSVMMNANFNVGFAVNREKLGDYVSRHCSVNVPPLTSGYMGMKIKRRVPDAVDSVIIPETEWRDGRHVELGSCTYGDYFAGNSRKLNGQFIVNVSVFRNGKVLVSGANRRIVDDAAAWIDRVLDEARDYVEIKPKMKKTFKR